MTDNEKINGWTFEETVKTAENLMEAESNMFKWDVLRHLRDFAESYKDKVQAFEAIGTIEEFNALKEKNTPKKPLFIKRSFTQFYACPHCSTNEHYEKVFSKMKHCENCGGTFDWQ